MLFISIDNYTKCLIIAFMNQELNYTKHAQIRCSQRGISSMAIQTILKYGHFNYIKGAKSWSMNRQEKAFAKYDLGKEYKRIEKQLGYLIVSHDGTLITAAHTIKRLKR